jgi:hypothetical protein
MEDTMSKVRYCECGRKIMVQVNGRMISPTDPHHDLCSRCYARAMAQFHNQFNRSRQVLHAQDDGDGIDTETR